MRVWLRQHRQAFAAAMRKVRAQGAAALFNSFAIGVALALPAGGYALLGDLQSLTRKVAHAPQISVYLRREATRAEADALGLRLGRDPRVRQARFVPREAALARLRTADALAEVAATLGENPLPDAFVIEPADPAPAALEALARELRALAPVTQVQVDSDWARRLVALAVVARTATGLLTALLGLGLIAITFTTVRLQILTQRTEIEVSRLIGATDAFIRRPFYYLGLLQGFAGGLVALALLWGCLGLLNNAVAELSKTYGAIFQFRFLGLADAIAIAAFSGLVGWLGAYMSVSKYLREIDNF